MTQKFIIKFFQTGTRRGKGRQKYKGIGINRKILLFFTSFTSFDEQIFIPFSFFSSELDS